MTKDKDFKRLVRARMAKTGERYAAAHAQLTSAVPGVEAYAELAGMPDATVLEKTGRTWQQWCGVLDAVGARELPHAGIAKRLASDWPELTSWWVQTVTVGYERIRGLRATGQLCTGEFAAAKSKTFAVGIETLYAAFGDDRREAWMGPATLRSEQPGRSMRLVWPDGTLVSAWFTEKGPAKSAVAIQHEGLATAEQRTLMKAAWNDRLVALAKQLP